MFGENLVKNFQMKCGNNKMYNNEENHKMTEEEKIVNEKQFREEADDLFDYDWNQPNIFKYFSRDFFREFRDKFEWIKNQKVTAVSIFIWGKFGEKFFTEMTSGNDN